tara:strand:+ start:4442 stop:4876 length:435 start_codon:yes stop_codon:yes gene_type:complete
MRYLLTLLLVLFTACGSQQTITKCQHKVEKSKYSSHKEVGEMLKAQSQGLSTETVYIIFSADWCWACNKLYRLLQDAGIEKKVVFVDIEKTWGFLFSREMGIKGVPALAIINSNKTIQVREGLNKILTYLVAHLDSNKDIKLIQ